MKTETEKKIKEAEMKLKLKHLVKKLNESHTVGRRVEALHYLAWLLLE